MIPDWGSVPFWYACIATSHWVSPPPGVHESTPKLLTAKLVGCGQVIVPQVEIPV